MRVAFERNGMSILLGDGPGGWFTLWTEEWCGGRFAVAAVAAGATSQAGAAQLSGPGVVTLPDAVVSGTAGATATGYIADPTDDTDTETTGTQNTALTGPGSTPIDVAAPISGPYGLPGYSWISSTSSVTGSVNVRFFQTPASARQPIFSSRPLMAPKAMSRSAPKSTIISRSSTPAILRRDCRFRSQSAHPAGSPMQTLFPLTRNLAPQPLSPRSAFLAYSMIT